MHAGQVIIRVRNCRCAVSRYEAEQNGLVVVPAFNWEKLEDQARAEVQVQGGRVTQSGHYSCPQDLAAQATWPVDPKEERRARRALARARRMLPLLYADLEVATGKARRGIEREIDGLEDLLEQQGLAYDRKPRQVYAIADEDDDENEWVCSSNSLAEQLAEAEQARQRKERRRQESEARNKTRAQIHIYLHDHPEEQDDRRVASILGTTRFQVRRVRREMK